MIQNTGAWVIDHTYVDPRFRGRQLGKQLLDRVVRDARDNGRTIISSCHIKRVASNRMRALSFK
ncbi:GNAT family N-acetyltransferase [Paenibacillus sp. 5J-6]|uniref:GNAT family N-acetyltransferase n=2 Tax=Paenibacillus silvestris TaxID=2606219 RepID=A0A6L8UYI9_9BACL|nr:GNAT family N-acetyltransferase [Paenibacillus silvestris]